MAAFHSFVVHHNKRPPVAVQFQQLCVDSLDPAEWSDVCAAYGDGHTPDMRASLFVAEPRMAAAISFSGRLMDASPLLAHLTKSQVVHVRVARHSISQAKRNIQANKKIRVAAIEPPRGGQVYSEAEAVEILADPRHGDDRPARLKLLVAFVKSHPQYSLFTTRIRLYNNGKPSLLAGLVDAAEARMSAAAPAPAGGAVPVPVSPGPGGGVLPTPSAADPPTSIREDSSMRSLKRKLSPPTHAPAKSTRSKSRRKPKPRMTFTQVGQNGDDGASAAPPSPARAEPSPAQAELTLPIVKRKLTLTLKSSRMEKNRRTFTQVRPNDGP